MHRPEMTYIPKGIRVAHTLVRAAAATAVLLATAWSAILVKESTVRTPLVQASQMLTGQTQATRVTHEQPTVIDPLFALEEAGELTTDEQIERILASAEPVESGTVRWFDGRRVVPVRTIWMKVTAYSPDARSCGKWADGQTATLHSVWTNAMRLVAADTRVLPYGSIITVPGYADSEIIPVLDCGGAIKGNRLDVLFPTHEIARKWGVRNLAVTVWAYEDELEG